MNRDEDLLRRIQDVLSRDNETLARLLHPDFNRYFRFLLRDSTAIADYIRDAQYLSTRGELRGHVLDLAAGFGLMAVCLRMLGVDSVIGLDIVETKVATSRELARLLEVDRCVFHRGDGRRLPFEDDCFDGVLIKDAASHFNDPMSVWTEARRVLKPGGRLLIVDDRNQLNPHVVAATQKIWETSETGSETELRSLGIAVSFTQMRRDYIGQHFPDVAESTRAAIADQTRGLTFAMLDCAVPLLLEGKSPDVTPLAPCVNPATEIVQERLIDPRTLARDLERVGFTTMLMVPAEWDPKIWRHRGGNWKGVLARFGMQTLWRIHALRPALLPRMDHFLAVARKR